MSRIFISHSSQDNRFATEIKTWLENNGHTSLFLDFDPAFGIKGGSEWEQVLYRELRHCQAFIAILTPSWFASHWCRVELTQAREKGKAIFVIKAEPCDDMTVLPEVQHIDLSVDKTQGFQRLAAALLAKGLGNDSFAWDLKRSPYPGLHHFEAEDAAIFFGRDPEIFEGLEVLNRLQQKGAAAPRFALFLGASGSGKSSLVRAGILPRLAKDTQNWLILRPFRPQSDPLAELAVSLAEAFNEIGLSRDWQAIRNVLHTAAAQSPPDVNALLTPLRYLQSTVEPFKPTVLMVIDQFEAVLGTSALDSGPFLQLLRATLAHSQGELLVLATMRSDFFSEFQTHPALTDLDYESVTVPLMPLSSYPQIIEQPAELVGVRLEAGLVSEILQDAQTQDALPLLAFMMRRLHDRYGTDGLIQIQEYRDMGGLEASVRQAADQVLQATPHNESELDALRQAFIPHMVRVGDDGQYVRRLADRDQLPTAALPLLQRFVAARLLISDQDLAQRETLEVAHEALLRTWPLLKGWLDADRDNLQLQEGLQVAAQEWQRGNRSPELLVHRQGRLQMIQDLIKSPQYALAEGSLAQDYVVACTQLQLKQKQAQRRRIRWTIGGLSVGLLLVSILATSTLFAWNLSEQRRISWVIVANSFEAKTLLDAGLKEAALLKALEAGQMLQANRATVDVEKRIQTVANIQQVLDQLRGVNQWEAHQRTIQDVQFSSNGQLLASASQDRTIKLWTPAGNLQRQLVGHKNTVNSVAFSLDGRLLASASEDRTIKLWTVAGKLLKTLTGHRSGVKQVQVSPDGGAIASLSADGTVKRWTWAGEPLATLDTGTAVITAVGFRQDDPSSNPQASDVELLTADRQGIVTIWNAQGQPVRKISSATGRNRQPNAVALSPNGQLATLGEQQGSVQLWSLADQQHRTFERHQGAINHVSFSPDGQTLASAGNDQTIKLWSLVGPGKLLYTLEGHSAAVQRVRFSPDAQQLVSASQDGTLKLWNFNLNRLVAQGCQQLQRLPDRQPQAAQIVEACQIQTASKQPD